MAERNTMDTLFQAYLDGELFSSDKDQELAEVSGQMDEKLGAGTLTTEDLAAYELSATQAGFYAGFKAAHDLYATRYFRALNNRTAKK